MAFYVGVKNSEKVFRAETYGEQLVENGSSSLFMLCN